MSENTEIRIIGTEVQENNALVYADTKLQTLNRRVGKDNLYFDKELFEESLKDWENTPVIYQKDGIHPDDFAAVVTDPKKAAEAIGGYSYAKKSPVTSSHWMDLYHEILSGMHASALLDERTNVRCDRDMIQMNRRF